MAAHPWLANLVDKASTKVNLPFDLGISERLNGKSATANTGRVPLATPLMTAGAERNYNNAAFGQSVTGNQPWVDNQTSRHLSDVHFTPSPSPTTAADVGPPADMYQDYMKQLMQQQEQQAASDRAAAADANRLPDLIKIGPDGRPYNLNIEEQKNAYVAAQRAKADTLTGEQRDQYLRSVQDTLAQSADQYSKRTTALDEDYRTLERNKQNLAETYDQGTGQRAASFAAMGPNAFQSAQAADQGYAKSKLDQSTADIAHQQNLKADEKTGLVSKYDQYMQTLKGNTQKDLETIGKTGYDEGNDVINEVSPYDLQNDPKTDFSAKYGLSPFQGPDANAGAEAVQKATPFVSFSALPGQSGASGANPFANLSGRASSLEDDAARKKDKAGKDQYLYA